MRYFSLQLYWMLLLGILSLASCNQKTSDVQINTTGIFVPITFGIDDEDASGKYLDKGEWVTSDGPKTMAIKVQNNTFFTYSAIDLEMRATDSNLITTLRFKPNNQGDTEFPGAGGTCQRTLSPGLSCIIIVEFLPLADGTYEEQIELNFKNWVEDESHLATLGFVSGEPAELIFNATPSKIPFGTRVGSNYIIERTINKTYDLKDPMFSVIVPKGYIEVKNVGGLAARGILTEFEHKCSDVYGSICVDDVTYGKAFTYSLTPENCGTKLRPGESCRIELFYHPKNFSETTLPAQFERIKYEGALAIKYTRRPDGQRQTLGLSMESISSKIEGFLASNASIDLSDSGIGVIQGNEIAKKIRVENIGFSKVRFKKIILTKSQMTGSADEVWGICEKISTDSNLLHCFKPNSLLLFTNLVSQFELQNLIPPKTPVTGPSASIYESLPFVVEDLGQGAPNDPGCFAAESALIKAPLIEINGGCFINLSFRPSSKKFFIENLSPNSLDAEDSNYSYFNKSIKAFVLYDSQWKNGEDHCLVAPDSDECPSGLVKSKWYKTNFSFEIFAKRRAAAKVVVQNLTYNQAPIELINDLWTQSLNTDWSYNKSYQLLPEGRIELLAYGQRHRSQIFKNYSISLTNIGGTKAILESPLDDKLGISWPNKGSQSFSLDGQSDLANLQDANNCANNTRNECFYRSLSTKSADCRKIDPGSTCVISLSYAPFSLGGDTFLQGKANYDEYPEGAIPSWSPSSSYNIGDFVTYSGLIYKALITHSSGASFVQSDWEPLNKSFTIKYRNGSHLKDDESPIKNLVNWTQLKQYQVNDEVLYDSIRFKCKESHNSGIVFDVNKWNIDDRSVAEAKFKIRSKMISVGKLEEMADNFYNQKLQTISTDLVKPSEMTFRYWFTNIGAGQVAHLQLNDISNYLNGAPECGQDYAEGGTGELSGKDCRCYSSSTPLAASTSCTSGGSASDILASEQSCYLPIKWNLWMDESPIYPIQSLTHSLGDRELVNYVYAPDSPSSKSISSTSTYKNCYTKSASESSTDYNASWGYQISQSIFTTLLNNLDQPAKIIPSLENTPTGPWHVMGMGRRMGPFTKPDATQNPFDPRFFYWDTQSSNLWSLSHGSGSKVANLSHNAPSLIYSLVGSVDYFNPQMRTSSSSYNSINDAIQSAADAGDISYYLFLGKFAKYALASPSGIINSSFSLRNSVSTQGIITAVNVSDVNNTLGGNHLQVKMAGNTVQSDSNYNLVMTGPQVFNVLIDPASCSSGVCIYSKSLDFTYDTLLNHKEWNGSTFVKSTTRPENWEKKIRVTLIAEVDAASTQPVQISHGDYQGELAETPPQTFDAFNVNPADWNQSQGQSNFTQMVFRTEKNKKIQKAIKFKNTSAKTIKFSSIILRTPYNSGASTMVSATDLNYWGITLLPNSNDGALNNYTRCNVGAALAPGQECYNIIRFYPTRDTTGSGKDYYLTYLIKENSVNSDKAHELLNLPVNLATISPSRLGPYITNGASQTLLASNLSPYYQNLSGWTLDRNPFRFSIPDVSFQGKISNGEGGYDYPITKKYFKIRYLSTTDAKSSFLAQYREFKANNTIVPHPQNDFSDDSSPDDGSGTLAYTLIWEKNLNSLNHGLMKVFASRECIFGNNAPVPNAQGVVLDNGSGFDKNENNCWLRVELTHNHKNMLHQTNFGTSANAASSTISPYLAQLRFYSVSRSSLSSMSLVAEFKSRPKKMNFTSSWNSISASHSGGNTINLTQLAAQVDLPENSLQTANYGQVLGYRLIRSNSAATLQGNLYQGSGVYLVAPRIFSISNSKPQGKNNNTFSAEDDFSSLASPSFAFNNASANRIYYYKLMAIVSHPGFDKGASLFGLSNNSYFLVETDAEIAKVITPNANYTYNHEKKVLIQNMDYIKFSNEINKTSYSMAKTECSSMTQTFYQEISPTSFSRSNQLINTTVWDLLPEDEIDTNYWIDTPSISFNDNLCGGFPEYSISSASTKCRKAINSVAEYGQYLIGNLTSQNLYPYPTVGPYVVEDQSTINWGFSRCYINLTNLISPNLP